MANGTERALSALSNIGDGLKSVGESFASLAEESIQRRGAVEELGSKLDKLQATADDIKAAIDEDRRGVAKPSR